MSNLQFVGVGIIRITKKIKFLKRIFFQSIIISQYFIFRRRTEDE